MRRLGRLQDRCQTLMESGGAFYAKSLAVETKIRTVSVTSHHTVQISDLIFEISNLPFDGHTERSDVPTAVKSA